MHADRSKVEIKNVNSFKAVQQAVDFEILRQSKAYDEGEAVRQETRMWDEKGTSQLVAGRQAGTETGIDGRQAGPVPPQSRLLTRIFCGGFCVLHQSWRRS